jgi:uncharacterized protein (DUF1778 family)
MTDRVNRTERLWIRVTPEDKATLEKAAVYTRQSVSGFVMSAAMRNAERLLAEKGKQGELI